MGDNRTQRQQSLDLLRFPLAVVVVVVHVFSTDGITLQGSVVSTAQYPLFVAVNRFVDAFLRSQSVPIYFFIAGFVFFLGVRFTRDVYIQKLRNRVKTLLIPYLIWNALALIILIVKMLPLFSTFSSYAQTAPFSLSALLASAQICHGALALTDPTNGEVILIGNPLTPIDGPLWFLAYLMVVVLLAPVIYWLLRRLRLVAVALLGAAWFSLGCLDFDLLYLLFTALFFFSFGAYMSINQKDMLSVFGRYFTLSMVLYPALAIAHLCAVSYFPAWAVAIKHLTIFAGLFFAYNFATWLLQHHYCKVNPFLAAASFFIYVAHFLICLRIIKVLAILLQPASDLAFVGLYLMAAAVTVALLLSIFYLLRRYCPTVLKVVAGRK